MKTVANNLYHFNKPQRLIRIKEMLILLGVSRATLSRWRDQGYFPQPKEKNRKALGWTETQYSNWLSTQ